jgi:hypothetical protein
MDGSVFDEIFDEGLSLQGELIQYLAETVFIEFKDQTKRYFVKR